MKLYSDIELAEILNQEVFHLISDAADALHLECYVVGGYVRDIFLERPSNDIDVVVVGSGIELAKEVKRRLGKRAHLSVFKNFGTAQVKAPSNLPPKGEAILPPHPSNLPFEGEAILPPHPSNLPFEGEAMMELEFVGARKESYSHDSRKPVVENGTLEDDQNRRDFTINAMAICLNKDRFGQLVDPFDGLYDLEDRIIATPLDPDITFSDDPLRMLRCVRFATQLNFDIEPETFEALGRNADRLKIISWERIADEMNKIMLSKHPSIGFDYLYRSGLLQIILPELVELDKVEVRNGRAHKNNYLHTLEVLENVCARCKVQGARCKVQGAGCEEQGARCKEQGARCEEQGAGCEVQGARCKEQGAGCREQGARCKEQGAGCKEQGAGSEEGTSVLWLRWAALLHDIGKPKSKRWDNLLGWTFHNHNYIGAKMVPAIFRRLKLPLGAEMKYVQKLVDLHMRPIAIADDEVTDSAVRRLLNDAGDDIDDLMTLCEADITSKNEVRKARFRENFRLVREKLADLQVRDYKRLLQPVIDGNEIMELFGLKPSREVGALKQCLKDAVLDNKVPNEREPLMQLLMEKARKMGLSSRKDC